MNLFYSTSISDNLITLPPDEAKHCIRVLRLKTGDKVHLTDGRGNLFETVIVDDNLKSCLLKIIQVHSNYGKPNFKLHMAVAPTKNLNRYEWFLEKATEIGIDEITPIQCDHSERKFLPPDRHNKIITTAMKQSLKAYHPRLNPMIKFDDFISQDYKSRKFIAYCREEYKYTLKEEYIKGMDATILIGPEGDFSASEVSEAISAGFTPVSLGPSRLRTETAALAACIIINLINQ